MTARGWRQFDFWLIGASLLLTAYGMALIYSGSLARFSDAAVVIRGPIARQVMYLALGLMLMIVLTRVDYRGWGAFALVLYGLSLAALVFVLVFGTSEFGSRRWITLAGFQIQPSEPAKLATIVLLAKLMSAGGGASLPGRVFLLSLGVAAVPALLVYREPDLGTAIVFVAVWVGMAFIGGAKARHLGLLAAITLVAMPFVMVVAVQGYQKERLEIFFNPGRDPLGTGYNINQASISIGSGGWFGKGLMQGTQTQLDFLRTQTTDYIFSVLGEELGFVGAMVLFALFVLLLFRGLRVATAAQDDFGRLVATGIVVMVLAQVFINIGVNVRLFPVTGIPLPFISQGGSSLMTMFMAVGLLQSILARRRPPGASKPPDRLEWMR
ncbi:MAG: rod shape-determining protein RodA [Chloroflexi bacterium]|nr:rod shape-determining protein RodA [Chloroflexota bacterium]